jgi:hypothetical protein
MLNGGPAQLPRAVLPQERPNTRARQPGRAANTFLPRASYSVPTLPMSF